MSLTSYKDPVKLKEYIRRRSKHRRNKFQAWKLKQKLKKICSACGYDKHPQILHYHHVNGTKESEVGKTKTMKKFLEEAKKCILLCPNCHAESHIVLK